MNLPSDELLGRPQRIIRPKTLLFVTVETAILLIINYFLVLVSGYFILSTGHSIAVSLIGSKFPGTVANETYSVVARGSAVTYYVKVKYACNGKDYLEWAMCDEKFYNLALNKTMFPDSDNHPLQVVIKTLPELPRWEPQLFPLNEAQAKDMVGRSFETLAALIVTCFVWWNAVTLPKINQFILLNGNYVQGSISRKQRIHGRGANCVLGYTYAPVHSLSSDFGLLTGEISVSSKVYDRFALGDSVTIFYDRHRPERNYPYELGVYEFV